MEPPNSLFDRLSKAAQDTVQRSGYWNFGQTGFARPSTASMVMYACHGGWVEVLQELLDLGLDPSRVEVSKSTKSALAPLALVRHATPNARKLLDLLLARGANPNVVVGLHEDGTLSSPMHAAASDPVLLRLFLDHGGSVHMRDANGWSVLDQWMRDRQEVFGRHEFAFECLESLLAAGWDPRTLCRGKPPLVHCWEHRRLREAIPRLIELGFDPRQADETSRESLLHLAEHDQHNPVKSAMARWVISHCQAQVLDEVIPVVENASGKLRL